MNERNGNGVLICFCGKMGSGKSTKSKVVSLERHAVLVSEDAWLEAHYPEQIHSFEDYLKFSKQIKPFIKSHVQSILRAGSHVVMDFPANTTAQRAWFKQLCVEIDCEFELYFLDVSDEQCLSQIARRRIESPERASFDHEAMFHYVTQFFEPPQESEVLTIIHLLGH